MILATMAARATNFTFTANSGDWNYSGNWNPNGVPTSGDTATIPNGKTCKIADANQSCTNIVIQSGGTLGLESRDLTLSAGSVSNAGTFYFDNTGGGVPRVLLAGDTTFQGYLGTNGIYTARITDGYGPVKFESSGSTSRSIIVLGITLKGSFQFLGTTSADITVDLDDSTAKLEVDHASDEMLIGGAAAPYNKTNLMGVGEAKVSAGNLKLGRASIEGFVDTSVTLRATGGTLTFTGDFADAGSAKLMAVGGIIDVDGTVAGEGGIGIGGDCQIKVAPSGYFSWE
ncbi:MAG: hypothetical protein JNG88_13640 [Phycisphaerales bacterium]|nr:hypothetical protein [Phycisphaerales bacterium]